MQDIQYMFCLNFKEGCWEDYNVPERVLCNVRHNCGGTYLRPITVVDLSGTVFLHDYTKLMGTKFFVSHTL